MTITLTVGGVDVWSSVIISSAEFTSSARGTVGACTFRVKDEDHTRDFVVGAEIVLTVDGVRQWAGYLGNIKRGYFFDAYNCKCKIHAVPRYLEITGQDYNILLQKRILYDHTTPTTVALEQFSAGTPDNTVITSYLNSYSDLAADGVSLSGVVHVGTPSQDGPIAASASLRIDEFLHEMAYNTGAIWYLDPDKTLVYCDVDSPTASVTISDHPAGAEVGCRELEISKDGINLRNDALIWGYGLGSTNGLPVFARTQDAPSITAHGRWQVADTKTTVWHQTTAQKIADSYVYGSAQSKRGGKDDRIAVACTVFNQPLRVAQKVPVKFTALARVANYQDTLPIRSIRITFPTPTDMKQELVLGFWIDDPFNTDDVFVFRYPQIQIPEPRIPPPIAGSTCTVTGYNTAAGQPIVADIAPYKGRTMPDGYAIGEAGGLMQDGLAIWPIPTPNVHFYTGNDPSFFYCGGTGVAGVDTGTYFRSSPPYDRIPSVEIQNYWHTVWSYGIGHTEVYEQGVAGNAWKNVYTPGPSFIGTDAGTIIELVGNLRLTAQQYQFPNGYPFFSGGVPIGSPNWTSMPTPLLVQLSIFPSIPTCFNPHSTGLIIGEALMHDGDAVPVDYRFHIGPSQVYALGVDIAVAPGGANLWTNIVATFDFLGSGTAAHSETIEIGGLNCTPLNAAGQTTCGPARQVSTNVFAVNSAYVTGTVRVYVNGLFMRPGIDWEEVDPAAGSFRLLRSFGSIDWVNACWVGFGPAIPTMPPASPLFIKPTSGTLAATFGSLGSEWDPLYWHGVYYPHFHAGIDFAESSGTAVYAAADGIVRWLDDSSGGTVIEVVHPFSAMTTVYSHLSSRVAGDGSSVSQGQLIGYSGTSGVVTTPAHLHFGLLVSGSPENPVPYMVST